MDVKKLMMTVDEALLNLETDRLFLRPFAESDYPLILRISSDPDTIRYLYYWGRIGWTPETDARRFLDYALKNWQKTPIRAREYCVVHKETNEAIGDGSVEWVENEPGTAEIGWILLPDCRGRGFATEMGRELMRAAFEIMNADRVIAHCDARNAPSYHVMERLGMRLDHIEKEARPIKREGEIKGDECTYLITREEWQLQTAWAEYHTYSCRFDHFIELPQLTDGAVSLQLEEAKPADPVKKHVPAYHFRIVCQGLPVGYINLRIGYPDSLFYGGQIGYGVAEAFRGRGIAGTACRLLSPVMRAHGMKTALITNEVTNAASRRVCEKIGARFLCQADVPENHEMYQTGSRKVNVFAFDAEN
jgi:RimJ/RimL family protein N-acetyltransferase